MIRLSISPSKYKLRIPRAFLTRLNNAILGKRYELSVAFVSSKLLRQFNRKYRRRNEPTDILSFPISNREGEILIAPSVARREAKKFGRPFDNFILFLLIHGLLHLKGMKHGSRMEKQEREFRKKFKI